MTHSAIYIPSILSEETCKLDLMTSHLKGVSNESEWYKNNIDNAHGTKP